MVGKAVFHLSDTEGEIMAKESEAILFQFVNPISPPPLIAFQLCA